jgi:FkbM family methyltransferase
MKNKSLYKAVFGEKLYKAYRYVKDKKDVYDPPVETSLGFKFSGNVAMMNGSFEPFETEIIKKLTQKIELFINVGANIGYYCCLALSSGKDVVAFEPIQSNIQYLFRNIKANNWQDKVEVFPLALSNQVGLIDIYGGGTGASLVKGWANTPEDDVTIVACSTMDRIIGDKYTGKQCLILVDVEGAERLMLAGATKLLTMNPKPIWVVEISITEHLAGENKINPNLMETFDIFYQTGYSVWTADEDCRPITRSEIVLIAETGISTVKTHNFIFSDTDYSSLFEFKS